MGMVILCLAALFFLGWVILLKLEIQELKETKQRTARKAKEGAARDGAVPGMKRFHID